MNAKPNTWAWFTDKVLPGLFLATVVAVGSASYATYDTVRQLTNQIADHDRQLSNLRSEVAAMRAANVTRIELLETLKRVEQQLEIAMLRAGLKPGAVKVTRD